MPFHTPQSGGSVEVFHKSPACDEHGGFGSCADASCHECAMAQGWYWWACFPGCLPDGDPHGPFDTEELAKCDAFDVEGEG